MDATTPEVQLLKEMAVFAKVVETGGFTAAARELTLTTSVVSRHVARLEAHLGARLLHRTTRSIALTELGQQVFEACQRVVSASREVQAFAGAYSARPSGLIKISAPVVFGQLWLAPRLPAFLANNPEVDIQLTLIDRQVDLVNEGVDLAIRITQQLSPGLAARQLFRMHYVLVATPNYVQKHGTPIHPLDLQQHQCIYFGYGRFKDSWTLEKGGKSITVKIAKRLTINNSAAILAAVLADGGIGLIPDFTAKLALENGQLVQVLADWEQQEPYRGTVNIAYLPNRHLPLKVRALIDYLVA